MKHIIRQKLLEKRNSFSSLDVIRHSHAIASRFVRQHEFINARTVMLYMSVRNEVKTEEIITYSLLSGKNVILPATLRNTREIIPVTMRSFCGLHDTAIGIPEPDGEAISKDEIDLVVVPGVAFDICGHRIGMGLGYYDRFLNGMNVRTISLAYEMQIVDNIPSNEWDVDVQKIVTENRSIICR